jgi:hypothetical protein
MSEARIRFVYDNLDISDYVENVEWSGHSEKPNRQLTVSLKNTSNGRFRAFDIENGKVVEFYNKGVKLFRGIVFAFNIDRSGSQSITAYDENVYLLKSTDTRTFKNVKASDIVRRICSDFGIPVGSIADTGYIIPKLILKQKTLLDMVNYALELTRRQTGKRYILRNENGRLSLVQFTAKRSSFLLETTKNIISADYSQSIEDTKTQVKVIGGKDDAIIKTVRNASVTSKYGVMQHLETMDEKATTSQVSQRADQLLKELAVINDQASIEVLGIDEITTGMGLYVREPMTGLTGGYFVTNDTHRYANGVHTMSLEIAATYELPEIEIEEEALGSDEETD